MNHPHWWENQHGSSVWESWNTISLLCCSTVQDDKSCQCSVKSPQQHFCRMPGRWYLGVGALRFTGFLRISSKNNPLYVYSVWIVKIKCTIDKYVWWLHGILWVLVLRYAHMCTGQSEHAVTANSLRSQQRHEQKGLNDVCDYQTFAVRTARAWHVVSQAKASCDFLSGISTKLWCRMSILSKIQPLLCFFQNEKTCWVILSIVEVDEEDDRWYSSWSSSAASS